MVVSDVQSRFLRLEVLFPEMVGLARGDELANLFEKFYSGTNLAHCRLHSRGD